MRRLLLLVLPLAAGCSLMVEPTIENLPCGEGDLCREGFTCVAGVCVSGLEDPGDGGGGSGGGGGGSGGDPGPCGGGCPDGQICDEGVNRCIPARDCTTIRCAPGETCAEGACTSVTPGEVGATCFGALDCASGLCLPSAAGEGICGTACASDAACGAGELCLIPEGAAGGYCAPASFPTCSRQSDCEPAGAGLVCTYWDFGGALVGACAAPSAGTAPHGNGCATGADCQSGLCGAAGSCTSPCGNAGDPADCPVEGEICGDVTVTVATATGTAQLCVLQQNPTFKPFGACCTVNEECESTVCAQRADGTFYCADPALLCASDRECDDGSGSLVCELGIALCAPARGCTP